MTIIDGKYHYSDPSMPLEGMRDAFTSGQVLPSAEAGLFDFAQHHSHNDGSGINAIYPSPSGFYDENQATIITDGEATRTNNVDETGVFHYDGLTGTLHNTGIEPAVMDFNIFNSFIHHENIAIPFVSDFTVNQILESYPSRAGSFQSASFIDRGEQPPYDPGTTTTTTAAPGDDSTTTTTTTSAPTTTTTTTSAPGGDDQATTTTTTTTTTAAPPATTTTTSAPATTTTTVAPGGGDIGGGDFSGGGGGGGYGGGY